MNFKVKMFSKAVTCIAHKTNYLSLRDGLTRRDQSILKMCIDRCVDLAIYVMSNKHTVSITSRIVGSDDRSTCCGHDDCV